MSAEDLQRQIDVLEVNLSQATRHINHQSNTTESRRYLPGLRSDVSLVVRSENKLRWRVRRASSTEQPLLTKNLAAGVLSGYPKNCVVGMNEGTENRVRTPMSGERQ